MPFEGHGHLAFKQDFVFAVLGSDEYILENSSFPLSQGLFSPKDTAKILLNSNKTKFLCSAEILNLNKIKFSRSAEIFVCDFDMIIFVTLSLDDSKTLGKFVPNSAVC